MEVKKGQWVRSENDIYKITDIFWKDKTVFYSVEDIDELDLNETRENHFWGLITNKKDGNHNFYITLRDYMIKDNFTVANTPQELVQDGDLGLIKEWDTIETIHTSIGGHYCYMDGKRHFIGRDITIERIYTPNEDKTQYTEQYRKDKC